MNKAEVITSLDDVGCKAHLANTLTLPSNLNSAHHESEELLVDILSDIAQEYYNQYNASMVYINTWIVGGKRTGIVFSPDTCYAVGCIDQRHV